MILSFYNRMKLNSPFAVSTPVGKLSMQIKLSFKNQVTD